jgi:UDP-N-acetylglucosamine:LPS N-acetylglucosamine transferase
VSETACSLVDPDQPRRILVVSARMGAGHTGVARELQRRLEEAGHVAEVVDFLDALPGRFGRLMERIYRAQLRYAPWSYDVLYRLRFRFSSAWDGLNALYTLLAGSALCRWVSRFRADTVVALYPLAATVLGRLREQGRLGVPTATFITDFGVHPLWVHAGVDLHLCVHPVAAEDAAQRSGGPVAATGPVVPPVFDGGGMRRTEGRRLLGAGDDDRVVLVTGGSWGIGDVERTATAIARCGRYVPTVLCGQDDALRRRLERRGIRALGWTDRVPELVAGADALVDNAGGLSCMEAFASGTPVVTYRPIAGHGRHNAAVMARAGVSRYPRTDWGLVRTLDQLTEPGERRSEAVATGRSLFVGDAVKEILDLAP